jgi:ariadne-1
VAGLVVQPDGGGGSGNSSISGTAAPATGGPVTCGVCMSELPAAQCSVNSCGHAYCDDCWRGHLQVQISDGKACHVTCMSFKCGIVCDEELVERVMQV